MQQCSFTEFCNELAQVLGTHQHAISKASVKPIMTKSVEVKEEEEDVPLPPQPSKSHAKKDKKISMQSSQIKDLRSKLDQAVAENSQIRELLSPATLTTAFSECTHGYERLLSPINPDTEVTVSSLVKAGCFLGKHHPSQLSVGKDGVTNPDQTCHYCKDMGHSIRELCQAWSQTTVPSKPWETSEEGLN